MTASVLTQLHSSYNRLQGKHRMGKSVMLEKHKAIYVPIPKVACTSLFKACAEILKINDSQRSVHDIYFPGINDLSRLAQYEEYFKFAFVRNPWDRLVSCYCNKIKSDSSVNNRWFKDGVSKGLSRYGNDFEAGMSFEDFANSVLNIPDELAEKHFRAQHTFITDREGLLIVDFVGKFESLREDFALICDRLNSEQINIPHLQKSSRESYKGYYSHALRDKVSKRFSQDIKLFKYTF